MKICRSYGTILIICLLSGTVHGQGNISSLFKNNVERGDQMFNDLYYEKAIVYYELAARKSGDEETRLKLANTYRLIRDHESAVKTYSAVFESNPEAGDPIHKFNYAESLLSEGQTEEALNWYEKYRELNPEDSRTSAKIHTIANLDRLKRDSLIMHTENLPFNSPFSDFAAVPYESGLVYTSARGTNTFIDPDYLREEDLLDLYFVKMDSSGFGAPVFFSKELNTHYHEGPVFFYPNEDKLILTRSNVIGNKGVESTDGKTRPQLYEVSKLGNAWSQVKRLSINNQGYTFGQGSVNATGDTLYFSSDLQGGYGGNDLYMATLVDGEWTDFINLGPKINTPGDEMYPLRIQNRLFFASTGHGGFGGLDNFKAYIKVGEITGVANMGYPVNSPQDDFAFYLSPETMNGNFSSNRSGGKGSDDIYEISIFEHVMQGVALQTQDNSPIENATISIFEGDELMEETVTDDEGNFHFYLPFSSDFRIEASREGYTFETEVRLSTRNNPVDLDTVLVHLRLQDLFVRGIVYDNQTQAGIKDATVVLENLTDNKLDSMLTGPGGTYFFPLSPDKKFRITAKKLQFVPETLEFSSTGIVKGDILNDFILDEEFVDKEVIYFDYNVSTLRRDSRPILNKVLRIMRQFPDDYLIIGAHADARGTQEYNKELSEERANSTLKYFTDRGIDPSRIIARGFGEAFIINRCTDGANCQEEDHSKNRRTELTVEKELPAEELEKR